MHCIAVQRPQIDGNWKEKNQNQISGKNNSTEEIECRMQPKIITKRTKRNDPEIGKYREKNESYKKLGKWKMMIKNNHY